MQRHVVAAVVLLGACAFDDDEQPDESVVEQAGSEYQGSEYQGSEYQGSEYQGSEYQGSEYQSTSLSGATYAGLTLTNLKVTKTSLEAWRRNSSGTWTQRLPNKLCTWNQDLSSSTCTTYSLSTQASPLSGMKLLATFRRADGSTFTGYVQIGTGTGNIGAVKADTSYAMHPGAAPTTCTLSSCENAKGCRKNCDLYTYDVRLVGVYDDNGQLASMCSDGSRAYALQGAWSATGQRNTSSAITFACMTGTIAKCTKWGYRPFGTGLKSNGTSASLLPYHQACVRAATADYCANGHSFTKNGTLVDIYDYSPHMAGSVGFIPRVESRYPSSTAFVKESEFDSLGAVTIDFERYQELAGTPEYGSLIDPTVGCPTLFEPPTAPAPGEYHQPYERKTATSGARVFIDSSPVCAHTEATRGKFLHPNCSQCTYKLWTDWYYGGSAPGGCVSASGSWDSSCVSWANANCTSAERMNGGVTVEHGECTAGTGLWKYSSGCTLTVCSDPAYASCCGSTWSSTCVNIANQRCNGGLEGGFTLDGFCGTPIVNNGG